MNEQAARFAVTVLNNPYIPHKPSIKQALFLSSPYEETFYGGAAGGGKTDSLLDAALQYVRYPQYRALLLRKSFQDLALPESLMDRAHQWLDESDAHWNAALKTWEFPSGATITFGYMQHERDKFRYKSAEFQFIGFDELTQFSESQYLYMFSRLRRLADSDIPIRMMSASNPGDVGHQWVKERFITPTSAELAELDRAFIPARLEDNPHLDAVQYSKSLNRLDPVTRAQLAEGNWDITLQGELFYRGMFDLVEGTSYGRHVRFWDFAATEELNKAKAKGPDWTVGLLLGRQGDTYRILDIIRVRKPPGEVKALMRQTAIMDGKRTVVAWEEEGGSAGKFVSDDLEKMLKGYRTLPCRNSGSKIIRAKPASAACSNGLVSCSIAPWNKAFFHEIERFPSSEEHDDQVDALSGAFYVHTILPGEGKPVQFATNSSGFIPQWNTERPF